MGLIAKVYLPGGSNEHYHANFLAQLIYMQDISLPKSDMVVVCLRRRNVR